MVSNTNEHVLFISLDKNNFKNKTFWSIASFSFKVTSVCLSGLFSDHLHAQLQKDPSSSATPHHLQTPHLHHGPEQHRVHAGRLPRGTAPSQWDVEPWEPGPGPGPRQGPLQLHRQPGQHQGCNHSHGGSGGHGGEETPVHRQPQLGAHLWQSRPGVQSWGVLEDTPFLYRDTGQSQHTQTRHRKEFY